MILIDYRFPICHARFTHFSHSAFAGFSLIPLSKWFDRSADGIDFFFRKHNRFREQAGCIRRLSLNRDIACSHLPMIKFTKG